MRALLVAGLLLAGAAAPALAAEGGPIRGGEHAGFSRLVLSVEPTTEWSLETGSRRASLFFPGKAFGFDTRATFDRLPHSRVMSVKTAVGGAGTTVEVRLNCDCRVSTSFVGARYLALDVADRDAPGAQLEPVAPVERPASRPAREPADVSGAEDLLLRQIERAAGQGLVEMSQEPAEPEPAEPGHAPAPEPAPVARPRPQVPKEPAEEAATALLSELSKHEQIEATTVFDRDSRRAAERRDEVPPPEACVPDERLDVAAWTNGGPLAEQLPALRRGLVGEFDTPNPEMVRDLARLYIRFGFGAEARALLQAFPEGELADRALLADMARVVDGEPATGDGPLALAEVCPGAHGLWLALGGVAPAFRDEAQFGEVKEAFAGLPPELRALLEPGLVRRLLEGGHAEEARLIYEATVRPGNPETAELRLSEAELMIAEGHRLDAVQPLAALAEGDTPAALDALTALVRLSVEERLPLPARYVTDLEAAAHLHRGSGREVEMRSLVVAALGRRPDLARAIGRARLAMADLPDSAEHFAELAVRAVAEADPKEVGEATYAETALGTLDLIARVPVRDAGRRTIATRLVELGLPRPALATLAPAYAAGDPAARLIAARAALALGQGDAAEAALGGLEGREAAELRARAFALRDDYDRALATLTGEGLAAEADSYAWPSGDWERAGAAAGTPERLAMAAYMAARDGGDAEPSPDLAALSPAQAFLEPLPSLERPTLAAAKRLLASGPQIGGFIQGLLAAD